MRTLPFLLSLPLVLFGFSSLASATEEIRIAYQPSPLYAPLFVAKEKGWVEEALKKENPQSDATVVWTSFTAGPAMNESFAANQQDVGLMGDTPALIGKSVGIRTKVVGLSVSGPKGQAVVVGFDSPVKTAKELRGKKVAVTKGSFAQHLLALVLEKEGMTFDDIQVINMPPAEIPVAILSKTIDAGVTWEPYISRYESEKAIRVLVDGTGLKEGVQPIIATEEALKKKPALVRAVLAAYKRGAVFLKENPKEAAKLASKESHLSPDLLEKVFAKQTFAPILTTPNIAEFKKTEAYMRKINLLRRDVDVDAWIDPSFLPKRGEP